MAPAFHCLLLGMAIELSNLFILSGRSDIVVPLLGFAIGLLVAGTLVKLTQTADPQRTSGIYDNRLYLYVNALVLYGFLLLLISLSPFDFEISLASIRNKFLNDSNFIPFMAHFSSRSISSAIDIVREFILYAPLGALLVLTLRSLVRSISTPVQLLLCGVFTGSIAMVLELLQLMVQGRYVDVTDCLLAVGGGIAGAILAPLFSEPIENKIAVKPQSQ